MLLLIDNFDSFTYNLVHIFKELQAQVLVRRSNDPEILKIARDERLKGTVISPGPGGPEDSELCIELLKALPQRIPVLGVCLGHQILAHFAGLKVEPAARIMHGKTSDIFHQGEAIFKNIQSPFIATRYHSLIISPEQEEYPASGVKINALSKEDEIMGIQYQDRPWYGIQFHPESILSDQGPELLKNFLELLNKN